MASPAAAEKDVGIFVIGVAAVIYVLVAALILYTIVRFRSRGVPGAEPRQVYGSGEIELAWTVIPILIVFILIGVTSRMVFAIQDAPQPTQTTHLTVVGHQWWWEAQYPEAGVVTANEIHIPVSGGGNHGATYIDLRSADVIHSFWVPQLAGKVDVIPNRFNQIWMDPRQPGVYLGNCAEYCGTQHARMLLRVYADEPRDFQRWLAAQKEPAAQVPSAASGRATFESLACINCHEVRGTPAHGKFGPDLTHLMSRQTLASGVMPNNERNLRAWVADPQQFKPGCLMPVMKLNNDELDSVMAYLLTLQ